MAHGPAVWLPVAQFGATVFLGIGAFWLARRQWVTASEKLKLDLYERRDKILDVVLHDLNEVIQQHDGHHAPLGMTRYNLVRLKTFFGGRTERYVDELIGALTPTIVNYKRQTPEERKDPASKAEREEFERFSNLILRLTPRLQDSALADMKIRVPSHRPWFSEVLAGLSYAKRKSLE
ncbi:hypothetical protein [Lichenibacterium ramalinae]|uniref:hypothetical protein n=1 Tax=Lichenibacterium ramalinae TaxID=2316527 RepID=UPI00100DAEB2|nr:hypothetical protein [Lichenibacterium ramalinae]